MDCPDPNRGAAATATAAGLPDDALVEILSRLPIKPLRRSKCVSRAWRDLIADPLHRKKLPQTLEGFFYQSRQRAECSRFINLLGTSEAPIVDPSFPFLKELPQISNIRLVGSCNGLLLLEHEVETCKWGCIVCNPATEQWVSIPVDWTAEEEKIDYLCETRLSSLIFDPAASPHFLVVHFQHKLMKVYSSETGAWSRSQSGFVILLLGIRIGSACVNGVLYFALDDGDGILTVDMEGKTWKRLPDPRPVGKERCRPVPDYLGQSQGQLHYIYHMEPEFEADDVEEELHADDAPFELSSNVNSAGSDDTEGCIYKKLFIWVLEDYDTEKWVLKHTVSFLELFGRVRFPAGSNFDVVTIHPDHNLVFLVITGTKS